MLKLANFYRLCEDSHLMDFMFEVNPSLQTVEEPIDAQMIGGNDDALYTVTSEVKKKIKNINVWKKQSNLNRQIVD